jgi:hypothetical protein
MSNSLKTHSLAVKDRTTKTISSGVVTIDQFYHVIAAETGSTDNLDTINLDYDTLSFNSIDYRPILCLIADSGDTITIKHGTGNIDLPDDTDVTLSDDAHIWLLYDGTNWAVFKSVGVTDHGSLGGLSDDDHTQYALLAGRAGGQTLKGGTGAGDDLTLDTTSNGTKGSYILTDLGGSGEGVILGDNSGVLSLLAAGDPGDILTLSGTTPGWTAPSAGGSVYDSSELNEASDYTTASTSFVDIDATNLSITLTISTGAVIVGFTGSIAHDTTNRKIMFNIYESVADADVAADDGILVITSETALRANNASFTYLISGLSASEHTFKLRWKTSGGNATLYAGAGTSGADIHPQFYVYQI